jgi:hypothetical protein
MTAWAAKYKDARWQKKRLEIMNRDGWACVSCGAEGEGVTLNVHHAYYESGKAPWEYPDDVLNTLCEKCHERIHFLQKKLMTGIMRENATETLEALVGYADGDYSAPFHDSIHYATGYVGSRIASRMCECDILAIVTPQVVGKGGAL